MIDLSKELHETILKEQEYKKYHNVWNNPEYRIKSHSLDLWKEHLDFFPSFDSALDIGCGLGLLFAEWNFQGIDAYGVDITKNCLHESVKREWFHKFSEQCLWEMWFDRTFDFGICADVMEHIPREKVKDTLVNIAKCCNIVLFKIAHFHTNNLGGSPLHLTIEPSIWWIDEMRFIGGSIEQIKYEHRPGLPDSVIKWIT